MIARTILHGEETYHCDGAACADEHTHPHLRGPRWHLRGTDYDLCQACYTELPPAAQSNYQQFNDSRTQLWTVDRILDLDDGGVGIATAARAGWQPPLGPFNTGYDHDDGMAWRYALDSATDEAAAARLDLAELHLATHQLVHAHGQ
jgi:hypothetical protein